MNIGDLLRSAFILTWRHKWMWIIGFLLSPQLLGESLYEFQYLPGDPLPIEQILKFMILGGIMSLVMFVASILINPALIIGAARSHRNQPAEAGECLRDGFEFFGRWFLLLLLWIAISAALVVFLVVPCVIALAINKLLGLAVLLFFLPVMLVVAVVAGAIGQNSFRCLVLENVAVTEAIPRGYALFKRKLWPSIGILLLTILIVLAIALPLTFAVMIPQKIFTAIMGEGILATLLKYGFSLIISIPVYGYLSAWGSNLWTVAFIEWFQSPAIAAAHAQEA